MFKFTNIPNHMDETMYIKSLSKEYYMPMDMIFCLKKELTNEKDFFKMLEWNKSKNGFGWKSAKKE